MEKNCRAKILIGSKKRARGREVEAEKLGGGQRRLRSLGEPKEWRGTYNASISWRIFHFLKRRPPRVSSCRAQKRGEPEKRHWLKKDGKRMVEKYPNEKYLGKQQMEKGVSYEGDR